MYKRQDLGGEKICLAYEYCSEPRLRNSEVTLGDWSKISDDFRTEVFPARHTLLDIEEVVTSKGFKRPKSMKDMEIIFRRHLDVNSLGFYEVGDPLPVPNSSNSMNTANLSGSVMEISDLERSVMTIYPDRENDTQYFTGGETEALERLRNKVTDLSLIHI